MKGYCWKKNKDIPDQKVLRYCLRIGCGNLSFQVARFQKKGGDRNGQRHSSDKLSLRKSL